MAGRHFLIACGLAALVTSGARAEISAATVQRVATEHRLTPAQAETLRATLARFREITQGVAGPTVKPMSEAACEAQSRPRLEFNPEFEKICGGPFMVPLTAAGAAPETARVCIDQFEWPNLPCAYPATWVKPFEAQAVCAAEGKRLCDAHEWEGACAGSLEPPAYQLSREAHNAARTITWSYGTQRRGDLCGFGVGKSAGCDTALQGKGGSPYAACGSNTFPAGAFPDCRGRLPVYDLHGNAAEHMALPTRTAEIGTGGGVTEMKGSWFFFPRSPDARVHPDDCRWRAPGWHRTRIEDRAGHANYHLGFRCCKAIGQ